MARIFYTENREHGEIVPHPYLERRDSFSSGGLPHAVRVDTAQNRETQRDQLNQILTHDYDLLGDHGALRAADERHPAGYSALND